MNRTSHLNDDMIRHRRDLMRRDLLDQMRAFHVRRRRRGRVARTAGAAALLLMISAAAWWTTHSTAPRSSGPAPIAKAPIAPAAPAGAAVMTVEFVKTDALVLERYTANSKTQIEFIDDDDMLTTLARLDRHTGLIRGFGQAWLTHQVADSVDSGDGSG